MDFREWPSTPPPTDELGVVVHGPVVVAATPTTVVGLRCVFAHPGGLLISLVGRVDTTKAPTRPLSRYETAVKALGDGDGPDMEGLAEPRLLVTMDDVSGPARPGGLELSTYETSIRMAAEYWIDHLPTDRRVTLLFSWPQADVEEVESVLTLASLDDLAHRTVSLLHP